MRDRPAPRVVAGALSAVAVVLFAGCNGDGQPTASPGSTGASPTHAQSPPSTSTPTTTTTTSTTEPAPKTVTIVAGGDVLLHEPTWAQADADAGPAGDDTFDFTPELAAIKPVVSAADLALCHLETPLAPVGGPYSGYPTFAGPPQIVDALAATGFDACSMASNHTWDDGLAGVERTATTLRDAGVTPYGAAVAGQPGNPTMVEADGVQVGLLSYAYGFNGSAGNGAVETIEVDDVLADAAAARAAGAQIVVASLHWGTEYSHDLNAQQRELAPILLASSDIDLLVCHHAHVVQPIARIDGEWVAYGLGNMLAAHATVLPDNEEGVLASFTFSETGDAWSVTEAGYLPIMVDRGPPLRMIDLLEALAGTLPDDRRSRYETAINRTREIVHRLPGSDDLVEIGPDG